MPIRTTCVVLALVGFVAGCNLTTEGAMAGTFTATVTGDVSATMGGMSIFATTPDGQFSMSMSDSRESQVVAFVGLGLEGRPAPGSYDVVPSDAETGTGLFLAMYQHGAGTPAIFIAESGTLEITSSSASRLQGSFTFEAVEHMEEAGTPRGVLVTGTFDSRCVQTGGTHC